MPQTSLSSYGKVYAVGHRDVEDIFKGEVFVQEKVDGSQFSFWKDPVTNEIVCRSRNQVMDNGVINNMFQLGVAYVETIADKLIPGYIYRGEYLQKPKHNTLSYDRIPDNHVILFEVETAPGYYLPPRDLAEIGTELGLEVVPLFYVGEVTKLDEILPFLESDSILGGEKVEGIVIKNYAHYTSGGHATKAKLVRADFQEKHQKSWKEANPSRSDVVQLIIETYRTDARWDKAIQHLRDAGELGNEPKDIGPLIKEIEADLIEECQEEIAQTLFKYFSKKITRGVTSGFPEYYKRKLAMGDEEDESTE